MKNSTKIPVSSEDMKKCKKWYGPLLTLVIVAIFGLFCFGFSPKVGAAISNTNEYYKLTVGDEILEFTQYDTPDLWDVSNTENRTFELNFRDITGIEQFRYVIFQKDLGETYCSIYYTYKNFVDRNDYLTTEIYDSTSNTFNTSFIPIEIDDTQVISSDFYNRFFNTIFPFYQSLFENVYYVSGWYTFKQQYIAPSIEGYKNLNFQAELQYLYETDGKYYSSVQGLIIGGNLLNIRLMNNDNTKNVDIKDNNNIIKSDFRVLLFGSQYVDEETYNILTEIGEFRYIENLDGEYTITDLLFGVADIPFHYLSQYMNISLFNTTIFTIFCTFITIALAIYIVKVFK